MLPQTILVLSLALYVAARPYPFANSTVAARQILNDLPAVTEVLPVSEVLPISDVPVVGSVTAPITAPVSVPVDVLPVTAPITAPITAAPITVPVTIGSSPPSSGSSSSSSSNSMSVGEASTTCGSSQLNCCNSLSNSGGPSVLAIGVQCSPINISPIGAQVPLSTACGAKAACCQSDTVQNGVVNVGCVAIASIV